VYINGYPDTEGTLNNCIQNIPSAINPAR